MNIIVGYENEKKAINSLRQILLKSDAYRASGIRLPRGLVLYGEPGVGKTQLARSIIAGDIALVELCAASCCAENAEEAFREVFKVAKENQPAVILLDELDKIAGTSDRYFMEANSNIQKMLLQELDSLSEEDTVLVVATCNDISVLGDALLRPGRFDRQIRVELPDEKTREDIFSEYFGRIQIKKDLDFQYLSRITPGYSGARIECLVNEVGIYAFENDIETITLDDVTLILNRLAFNGNEKSPIGDKNKLRMIAVHEAGHAVVAMAISPDSLLGVSVLPQGESSGHVDFVNQESEILSVKDLENSVAVFLGGHVAERVVYGEYFLGSGDDLENAESRMRFLTIAQAAYGYEAIVGMNGCRYEMINDSEGKSIVRRIITDKMNELDAKCEYIIRQNRKLYDEIVDRLVNNQTLTREELFEIKSRYHVGKSSEQKKKTVESAIGTKVYSSDYNEKSA